MTTPLLICADPGARQGFIASWLKSQLTEAHYDVGSKSKLEYKKLHTDWDQEAKDFNGTTIRIKTDYELLGLNLYLFLTKNVYKRLPDFPQDGFSLITVEKLFQSAKGWFKHDKFINLDHYDKVIKFKDTFDVSSMIDLYYWFNNQYPTKKQIEILEETNKINFINLDKNHAANIAAMIIEQEKLQNLREIERYWSVDEIYQQTEVQNLYDTIKSHINPNNYRRSDLLGKGVNDLLTEDLNDI